jgi:FkbM family methyltransferase
LSYLKNLWARLKFIYTHPLNKNRRVVAIINYLRWQIGLRFIRKKVIVSWVDDSQFIAGQRDSGLTGNLYWGFTEYIDMVFLLHSLRPSHKFIDVGANVGAYTILASKVIKAHSVAFEPLAETAERLRDQVYINRIEDYVDIENMGVGSENGILSFTNNNDSTNKVSIGCNKQNTVQVPVVTLDSRVSCVDPLFLKIDVEGYEFNVIEGAKNILSSDNLIAIIIELNGSGEAFGHTDEEIHEKLTYYDLIPISYEPITRTISRLDSYNTSGRNTIYVKDVEMVSKLCKEAPLRTVHTANRTMI